MSDTAKHTPGPWKAGTINTNGLPFAPITATTLIAKVYSTAYLDHPQAEANARLMAAAPDLLEALMMSQRLWIDYGQETDPEMPVPARHREMERFIDAAISKATGGA